MCHHFKEHQTIHHHQTLHAMPLAQAVTTVVAQPRTNACKLHCVEHLYSTTLSLKNVVWNMPHISLLKVFTKLGYFTKSSVFELKASMLDLVVFFNFKTAFQGAQTFLSWPLLLIAF